MGTAVCTTMEGATRATITALRMSIAAVDSMTPLNATPARAPPDSLTLCASSATVTVLLTSPPRKPVSSTPRVPYSFSST